MDMDMDNHQISARSECDGWAQRLVVRGRDRPRDPSDTVHAARCYSGCHMACVYAWPSLLASLCMLAIGAIPNVRRLAGSQEKKKHLPPYLPRYLPKEER